jgi:hypothetical protein
MQEPLKITVTVTVQIEQERPQSPALAKWLTLTEEQRRRLAETPRTAGRPPIGTYNPSET